MSKEKYGFVYIWLDKKWKRYYVGAHWGTEDDGYVCSSPWMKQAYNHRPEDFHKFNGEPNRRILYRCKDKKLLFKEESRYLEMIKDTEISPNTQIPRYYNLNRGNGHWVLGDNIKTISEKIRQKAIGRKQSKETIEKRVSKYRGISLSEEHKQKISERNKGQIITLEQRNKLSQAKIGKKLSEEQILKMSKKYKIVFPDGHEEEIFNLNKFSREHNLNPGHMCQVALGKESHHKSYRVETKII